MKYLALLLFSISFSIGVFAGEPEPYLKDKVFIGGYDPVAYQADQKSVKGSKQFNTEHKGVQVFFSSEENKKKFLDSPEKYWPAYNGYCAYAVSKGGGLVEINPKRFKIIDGRTYLFFDNTSDGKSGLFSTNTLEKWNEGSDKKQISAAEKQWKKLLK